LNVGFTQKVYFNGGKSDGFPDGKSITRTLESSPVNPDSTFAAEKLSASQTSSGKALPPFFVDIDVERT